jgi:hypothetical protein
MSGMALREELNKFLRIVAELSRTLSARSLLGTKNLILRSFFFNELASILCKIVLKSVKIEQA